MKNGVIGMKHNSYPNKDLQEPVREFEDSVVKLLKEVFSKKYLERNLK